MPDDESPSIDHDLETVLGSCGYRHTSTRSALVDVLARTGRPLTVTEIVKEASTPVSSAYRNLRLLGELGVVAGVHGVDRQERFELSESFVGTHRHHLVCLECGGMTDFVAPDDVESLIESLVPRIAADRGFRVVGHTLDLVGACGDCGDQRGDLDAAQDDS